MMQRPKQQQVWRVLTVLTLLALAAMMVIHLTFAVRGDAATWHLLWAIVCGVTILIGLVVTRDG